MQSRRRVVFGGWSLLVLCAPALAAAQSSLPGNTWESIAKLPELSGLWEIAGGGGARAAVEPPSLTPPYAARLREYQAAQARGEIQDTPAANCVPNGMPSIMTQPYPIELLMTPGKVTILIEAYSQRRQIFTDGREQPEDPDHTFNGHSDGHWEGDTLVVDTVGFTPATGLNNFATRHSDKMRIVERMRLTAPNMLQIETTVHDSEALTKPWTSTRNYARHRDWTLAEYQCQENNRNFTTDDGKAGINLEREDDE
jgi:hypothetical protein